MYINGKKISIFSYHTDFNIFKFSFEFYTQEFNYKRLSAEYSIDFVKSLIIRHLGCKITIVYSDVQRMANDSIAKVAILL